MTRRMQSFCLWGDSENAETCQYGIEPVLLDLRLAVVFFNAHVENFVIDDLLSVVKFNCLHSLLDVAQWNDWTTEVCACIRLAVE